MVYHSHFGKVHQPRLCEVGGALLDVGEVGEIDAEVGHTGRVTPAITCSFLIGLEYKSRNLICWKCSRRLWVHLSTIMLFLRRCGVSHSLHGIDFICVLDLEWRNIENHCKCGIKVIHPNGKIVKKSWNIVGKSTCEEHLSCSCVYRHLTPGSGAWRWWWRTEVSINDKITKYGNCVWLPFCWLSSRCLWV